MSAYRTLPRQTESIQSMRTSKTPSFKIRPAAQDYNCEAWAKLGAYVEEAASGGHEEFSPREVLGSELFSQIITLPRSISKLKNVKRLRLYGSNLQRIPPEIGGMESLEYFDPYTSYDLHWLPYEITRCRKLIDSRISTRALYGNHKTELPFPRLDDRTPVYGEGTISCSYCGKEIEQGGVDQRWISLKIGTDIAPLLACLCSGSCRDSLHETPSGHVDGPHKGGRHLPPVKTPPPVATIPDQRLPGATPTKQAKPTLFKRIRKIWER